MYLLSVCCRMYCVIWIFLYYPLYPSYTMVATPVSVFDLLITSFNRVFASGRHSRIPASTIIVFLRVISIYMWVMYSFYCFLAGNDSIPSIALHVSPSMNSSILKHLCIFFYLFNYLSGIFFVTIFFFLFCRCMPAHLSLSCYLSVYLSACLSLSLYR